MSQATHTKTVWSPRLSREENLPRAPLPPRPRPLLGGCEFAGVVAVADGAGVAGSTAAVDEEVPGCGVGGDGS